MAFFVLDDPIDKSNWQRLQLFKSTVLKSLKLVRSEVTLLGKVEFPENKVAFLLPDQVIPHLKHCTGWDKDWLFSLGVMGVQINQETVITVKEVKVAELRLQEDPGERDQSRFLGTCLPSPGLGLGFGLGLG